MHTRSQALKSLQRKICSVLGGEARVMAELSGTSNIELYFDIGPIILSDFFSLSATLCGNFEFVSVLLVNVFDYVFVNLLAL